MSLPKNPNRRKTYYKITNKEENHRGLQYHDGLVIDTVPFKFFRYGCWVRPVKISKDAKVIADPSGDKYRADKLFFEPRKDLGWYFDNLFDRKTFPENDYWILAQYCSKHFDKWFDKESFPKMQYWALALFCPNHFNKWFDKRLFPKNSYWALTEYCKEYHNKWEY